MIEPRALYAAGFRNKSASRRRTERRVGRVVLLGAPLDAFGAHRALEVIPVKLTDPVRRGGVRRRIPP